VIKLLLVCSSPEDAVLARNHHLTAIHEPVVGPKLKGAFPSYLQASAAMEGLCCFRCVLVSGRNESNPTVRDSYEEWGVACENTPTCICRR